MEERDCPLRGGYFQGRHDPSGRLLHHRRTTDSLRTSDSEYRTQKRGGKGVQGGNTHDEDFIEHIFTANTHDYIFFVMNNGRVYWKKYTRFRKVPEPPLDHSCAAIAGRREDSRHDLPKEIVDTLHLVMCTKTAWLRDQPQRLSQFPKRRDHRHKYR